MVTLHVKVDVTENREVTIKLPDDFPVGEARITIAAESESDAPLTDEEIQEFLRRKPGKTGAEIAQNPAIGSWAHKGITDSVEWVKELRRKRREKLEW
jgi:hypothetical protein